MVGGVTISHQPPEVNAAIRSLSRPRPRPETGVQLSSDLGIMEGGCLRLGGAGLEGVNKRFRIWFLKMDSDSFEASNSQIWDIYRIEPAISRWCRLGGSSFQCRCPRYNPPRWVHHLCGGMNIHGQSSGEAAKELNGYRFFIFPMKWGAVWSYEWSFASTW
jgi:hypothetical protein